MLTAKVGSNAVKLGQLGIPGIREGPEKVGPSRMAATVLKLKRDKERNGALYKSLSEEGVEGVEVRALSAGVTLKVKNLDEITDAEELVMALRGAGVQRSR